VESKFGVSIGRLECLDDEKWSLTGLDGQNLGRFSGVVVSDKSIASPRFTDVTGRPPPLGMMNLSLSSPGLSINLLLCLLEYIKQTHFLSPHFIGSILWHTTKKICSFVTNICIKHLMLHKSYSGYLSFLSLSYWSHCLCGTAWVNISTISCFSLIQIWVWLQSWHWSYRIFLLVHALLLC